MPEKLLPKNIGSAVNNYRVAFRTDVSGVNAVNPEKQPNTHNHKNFDGTTGQHSKVLL